jgi:hypothetical protein
MSKHPYPLVVRGEGQIATIQQSHTGNSIPVNLSDHWIVREHRWSAPNADKIYCDWGAERLFVTSCELASELVRALVKPICKRNLFFVILG